MEREVRVRQPCQGHMNNLNSCLQFYTTTKSLLEMHLTKDWGFHIFSNTIPIDSYSKYGPLEAQLKATTTLKCEKSAFISMSGNVKHHILQHLDYKPMWWRNTAKCKQPRVPAVGKYGQQRHGSLKKYFSLFWSESKHYPVP